jgi:hypothetical protein
MKHSSGPFPPAAGANALYPQFADQRSQERKAIGMLVGDLRQRRTVVDFKRVLYARIAENLATTGVRGRWYATRRPRELSGSG